MKNVMLDIETWGTSPDAVFRAIALVEFDPETLEPCRELFVDARPSVDEQMEHGRRVDESTCEWWKKQKPLGEQISFHDTQPYYFATQRIREVAEAASDFLRPMMDAEKGRINGIIWSRGFFDIAILENLYHSLEKAPHWAYWQCRDVRTLDSFIEKIAPKNPHDPLSDCYAQIEQVRKATRLFRAAKQRQSLGDVLADALDGHNAQ